MNARCLNILRVYHQATADEMASGLTFYRSANEDADRIAEETGLGTAQVAGVIAAMSPGMLWERNVEAAERVIRRESLQGLGVRWFANVRKARKIARGHDVMTTLKGNKTRAFATCIAQPESAMTVCIDFHAHSIWAGKRITSAEAPPINDRLYNRVSADYVAVARDCGILPLQMQAICWIVWRRLNRITKIGDYGRTLASAR